MISNNINKLLSLQTQLQPFIQLIPVSDSLQTSLIFDMLSYKIRFSRYIRQTTERKYNTVFYFLKEKIYLILEDIRILAAELPNSLWQIKDGSKFFNSLPIKKWGPCPFSLNLGSLCAWTNRKSQNNPIKTLRNQQLPLPVFWTTLSRHPCKYEFPETTKLERPRVDALINSPSRTSLPAISTRHQMDDSSEQTRHQPTTTN